MYAIIANGGKQYKVCKDEVLKLEKIAAEKDAVVEFDNVLMIKDGDDVKIGTPFLPGAKVVGKVVGEGRGEKISIIKFRRRKHSLKRAGHRQDFTEVQITDICANKIEKDKK